MLHVGEVGAPLGVDDVEHQRLLDGAHQLHAVLLLALLVEGRHLADERVDDVVDGVTEAVEVDRLQLGQRSDLAHPLPQALEVPVLAVASLAVGRHLLAHRLFQHRHQVLAGVGALEDLTAFAVDDLALLVHDVVVLDDVATGVEVVALHAGLRSLDLPRHEAVLDGHVLLDVEPVHDALHALTAEDAHQIVLEREEEASLTGVALAPRTAAQLIVDATRLVSLSADDVQATGAGHALAEHDVGAAAGHVGGDGHRAALPRVGNDLCLALVELGVEHAVRKALLLQQPREPLALLDAGGADEDRLAHMVALGDLLDHRRVFGILVLVDEVGLVLADHRLVGGDGHHLQLVDPVSYTHLTLPTI